MSKHILGYGVLITAVVLIAGQMTKSSSDSQNAFNDETENKSRVVEPADYRENKKELDRLQSDLALKEERISKLRESLDSQTVKIKKIKNSVENGIAADNETQNNTSDSSGSENVQVFSDQARESMKIFNRQQYAGLLRKLNLSAEDQEKLLELVLKRDEQQQKKINKHYKRLSNDPGAKVELVGGATAIELDAAALEERNAKNEADHEIAQLLGSDYQLFEKYENTRLERYEVKSINKTLDDADKLSYEQQDKLIEILSQRHYDIRTGYAKSDEEYISEAGFLNNKQAEELRKHFKRNLFGGFGTGAAPFNLFQ